MRGSDTARIGLITDNDLHRHILQKVLRMEGYHLAISLDANSLTSYFETTPAVELDAWLVDLVTVDAEDIVDILDEQSDLPMLVNDDIPKAHDKTAYDLWQKRMIEKLEVVAVRTENGKSDKTAAVVDHVWVLAASLGGPDAVKRFLNALPGGLALGMVYAQHIQVNFDEVLASAVGSTHEYPLEVVRSEHRLIAGEVAVVPADRQLRFLPLGRIVATRKAWTGLYQPPINQVISDLARIYRDKLGVIIFSGLCDDGEIGCRVAKACGATVWAQTPESCQSPEMAKAAISTGSVSFQGTPEQLAQALAERYEKTNTH